ncbi:MAG: tetratricopeptide repeat protein [bacterium]|nr:tetratricopeptide repeat protein [bacterium]
MQSVSKNIIVATVVALPLFFLSITTEFYDFNKQILLLIVVLAIIVITWISYVKTRTLNFTLTALNVPILLFVVATLLSLFLNSPNKTEAIFFPLGGGTIMLMGLWYLIVANKVQTQNIKYVINGLVISATVLSIIALLQYTNVGPSLFGKSVPYLATKTWNPTGSPLTLVLFLIAILPLAIINIVESFRNKKNNTEIVNDSNYREMATYGLPFLIITLTIALYIPELFTNSKPILLPYSTGWTIAADTMKNVRTAALGVGPLNYMMAFTSGRPVSFNANQFWNVRFSTSSNEYLKIITELGIVGLIAYLLIVGRTVRKGLQYIQGLKSKQYSYNPLFLAVIISTLVIFIEQLLFPSTFIQYFLLFTLLGLLGRFISHRIYNENSNILFYIFSIVLLFFMFFTITRTYGVYAAEVYLKKSIDSARANKNEDIYNFQIKAINSNPYIDRYHTLFAQTNLAFALSLSQKKDISDSDKTTLAQLLSNAAQEGKNAVLQNPTNVQNWESLASVYRAMMGAVKDADAWTAQSYQQAINLDPVNPNLYLSVGGLFYGAKNYDAAIQNFQQAVRLKPDFANAHYNLAAAYREKKDFEKAASEMQAVISLLPSNSTDREKAQKELDDIKQKIPATPVAPAQGSDLQAPVGETQTVNTPVDVPQNAAPDNVIRNTPRPSASLAPTAQPSVQPTTPPPGGP